MSNIDLGGIIKAEITCKDPVCVALIIERQEPLFESPELNVAGIISAMRENGIHILQQPLPLDYSGTILQRAICMHQTCPTEFVSIQRAAEVLQPNTDVIDALMRAQQEEIAGITYSFKWDMHPNTALIFDDASLLHRGKHPEIATASFAWHRDVMNAEALTVLMRDSGDCKYQKPFRAKA